MDVFKKAQKRFMLIPVLVCALLLIVVFGAIFSIALNSSVTNAEKACEASLSRPLDGALNNPYLEKCVTLVVLPDGSCLISKGSFFGDTPLIEAVEKINNSKPTVVDFDNVSVVALSKEDTYMDEEVIRYAIYDFTSENQSKVTLRNTLLIVYFITLTIIGVLSYIFAASAVEPLKIAFRKQQDLVANASHELKTPLTIASTNLDLVASDPYVPTGENMKWIESAKYQIERMNSLVLQMLELCALDNQSRKIQKEYVNVSDLCEGIALTFDASMYEKNITFNCDIKEEVYLYTEPIELEKLITILLDNANKYTSENGTIDLNLKVEDKNFYIEVKNYGSGLDKESLDKVFERFYKTDLSHKESGNSFGLGLSIAKSISTLLGGDLTCDSDGENWTSFRLTLPYKPVK